MKFVVYGIEVHSPVILPLSVPSEGTRDQVLRLQVQKLNEKEISFACQTPVTTIHGRQIQLFSNISFSSSRVSEERQWKIDIEGLFSFFWSNSSDTMMITYAKAPDLQKLSFWLLHTIIPIYLMLKQKSVLLHASAVEVDGKATLFIAPSFGGKSTLADFFMRQGHCLLSDDKIRLQYKDRRYSVYPSYPYRRPYREFETLGEPTEDYSGRVLSFGNVYVLNHVAPEDDCSIELIQGLKKFELLKKSYLYEPVSMSGTEMEYLVKLVQHSVLYQINVPKDLTRLEEVYQAIIENERSR
jgi:serine kinase of HPr protein (carbohydrate metabolism regulator)